MTPASLARRTHGLILIATLAGCAGRPSAVDPGIADAARREERLKIMQRYWSERTGARGSLDGEAHAPLPVPPPPLAYPAGVYDGLRFAPRTAADPGLGEPLR